MRGSRILKAMEIHFTPEQEAQLTEIAVKAGSDPRDESQFLAAVEAGIAAAKRGEFIEEDEMDARIERMSAH